MNVLLISDSIGLGLMEARPEPAWKVRLTNLRNKDLLAPDYGAMYVAAYLKASGHPARVINLVADVHEDVGLFREPGADPEGHSGSGIGSPEAAAASRSYLFSSLEEYEPDLILFPLSVYNLALYSRSLLGDIRKACPHAIVVTGGIYSTLHPEEILREGNADVVIRGEGELTALELLHSLEAGKGYQDIPGISYRAEDEIVHNPPREPIADLDTLPHIYTVSDEFRVRKRFDMLSALNPEEDYIPGGGFLTSRGCPEACTFCLDPALNNGRTRFHSPEYVRNVLDYCRVAFPGSSFFFGDATFTINRKRLTRILGLIADVPYTYQIQTRADYLDPVLIREMAEAGFTTVAIGAESFNEKVLQEVVKKRTDAQTILDAALEVRRAGMNPVLTFIAGLPGESRESILRTVEILQENGLYTATFFPLVVFRGTALFELFKERVSRADREVLRLNHVSEEFLFLSDEFSSREELTFFTEEINRSMVEARKPVW